MDNENLLTETVEFMEFIDESPEDIIFIGSEHSGYECTWDEFVILADREYDSGFGAQEVAEDLIIVFSDGCRMFRREYDGSECWRYVRPFVRPEETKKIRRLFVCNVGWETLAEIHIGLDDLKKQEDC